ncbi:MULTISPECIES: hypothetical protein [Streptomyces]|jgi:predicted component of type VI protein secretion system|uniref:Secreted protein n=1 Tax=Streptomyces spinosisporus TaxID=2927582 RepID=A0ABS9XB74_9ACTN|nr:MULTISPECIES: hypothetical protein [Streptomyces]MCI3239294.1 hypothetical protein [Streptomyces spinosisporus]WUB38158.1 hypothetical protein OHN38_25840 [Streptomyces sp. NBC_00588]
MRGLSARRIAATALCATLLVGITGPAAVAADTARDHTHAASRGAPVPGADALLAQVKSLGDLGSILAPVSALLNAVLKADNGQLSADEAQKLVTAVKDAIAAITAPAATMPGSVAKPAVPSTSTVLPKPHSAAQQAAHAGTPAPKDLKADALAGLQKALDTLLAAVTSGDVSKVVPAVTGVLTAVVNFLAATLLNSGLPAPDLPGLPALPSLPLPVG